MYCPLPQGTDAGRLADCLGLDSAKYGSSAASSNDGRYDDALTVGGSWLDDEGRYTVRDGTLPWCTLNLVFFHLVLMVTGNPAAAMCDISSGTRLSGIAVSYG